MAGNCGAEFRLIPHEGALILLSPLAIMRAQGTTNMANRQKSNIGRIVKEARKAAGLSWYMVAKRAGVSPHTVRRIEDGENIPNVAILEKLADALNCRLVVEFEALKKR